MPLTDMQREYLANCNHRWNIKTGATGSGKSFLDYTVVIPKRVLACRGEGLIAMMGNTRGTLERNILQPMRDYYGETLVSNIHADSTVDLFGKKAYILGADNKKHVARLQGMTIEYAYGDEVPTWAESVFQMLKSRLRCQHSHFDGTGNPEGSNHWFKKFLDDASVDTFAQSYTIDDNPTLPETFVKGLKAEYAGTVYYQRYILGRWVAAEGAIYRAYADDPTRYALTDEWRAAHPLALTTIGVDFGGNGSGHAFTCTGFTAGFREVATLAEWYHKGEISPERLEREFVDFARVCCDAYKVRIAYCDSAETTLIQGLRAAAIREGLPIEVRKARKSAILDRIRCLCRLIAAGRYRIADECRHTREALATALWDAKSLTQDKRLDNGTTNIDSLDALEYSYEPYMSAINYGGLK